MARAPKRLAMKGLTMTEPMTKSEPDSGAVLRRLRFVRWVALADALLLVALISASLLGNRELVSVLGPVHGGNFLALVVLVFTGVTDGLWSWWFLAATVFTGGPPGAFIGEVLVSRRLKRAQSARLLSPEGPA